MKAEKTGMNRILINRKIRAILSKVNEETGQNIGDEEAANIYRYTKRKCRIIGKGRRYIPILYENELKDYLMRSAINKKGIINRMVKEIAHV